MAQLCLLCVLFVLSMAVYYHKPYARWWYVFHWHFLQSQGTVRGYEQQRVFWLWPHGPLDQELSKCWTWTWQGPWQGERSFLLSLWRTRTCCKGLWEDWGRMLQLRQEWPHLQGLQGTQEGEGASVLQLWQGRPHGPWLWPCQRAEVLLLWRLWTHSERLWESQVLQVRRDRSCRRAVQQGERGQLLQLREIWPRGERVHHRGHCLVPFPCSPLLFLIDGCIIFSESSSLAIGWQIEAIPRPVSSWHVKGGKGWKKTFHFLHLIHKMFMFSLVEVLCIMLC